MTEHSQRSTRDAYRDALLAIASPDQRVFCLDTDSGVFAGADLGAAGSRFANIGIAEHNLMGIAAGLAATGFVPFVTTMAAFVARAAEAIKIDIAYNDWPVRIVGTHGGFAAGHLGPTHHGLEDLALLRALPNMTVVVPADPAATEAVVAESISRRGPVYVRVGRKATPALPIDAAPPKIGELQRLRPGREVVLVACGPHPVVAAHQAAEALAPDGVEAAVLNAHTLKPLDTDALVGATADARLVVTVEEHWAAGGLGSLVAESLAAVGAPAPVLRLGVERFAAEVGDHEHLLARHGLCAESIVARVRAALEGRLLAGTAAASRALAIGAPTKE